MNKTARILVVALATASVWAMSAVNSDAWYSRTDAGYGTAYVRDHGPSYGSSYGRGYDSGYRAALRERHHRPHRHIWYDYVPNDVVRVIHRHIRYFDRW